MQTSCFVIKWFHVGKNCVVQMQNCVNTSSANKCRVNTTCPKHLWSKSCTLQPKDAKARETNMNKTEMRGQEHGRGEGGVGSNWFRFSSFCKHMQTSTSPKVANSCEPKANSSVHDLAVLTSRWHLGLQRSHLNCIDLLEAKECNMEMSWRGVQCDIGRQSGDKVMTKGLTKVSYPLGLHMAALSKNN